MDNLKLQSGQILELANGKFYLLTTVGENNTLKKTQYQVIMIEIDVESRMIGTTGVSVDYLTSGQVKSARTNENAIISVYQPEIDLLTQEITFLPSTKCEVVWYNKTQGVTLEKAVKSGHKYYHITLSEKESTNNLEVAIKTFLDSLIAKGINKIAYDVIVSSIGRTPSWVAVPEKITIL